MVKQGKGEMSEMELIQGKASFLHFVKAECEGKFFFPFFVLDLAWGYRVGSFRLSLGEII